LALCFTLLIFLLSEKVECFLLPRGILKQSTCETYNAFKTSQTQHGSLNLPSMTVRDENIDRRTEWGPQMKDLLSELSKDISGNNSTEKKLVEGLPELQQQMVEVISQMEKYKYRSMLLQDALRKKFTQLKEANVMIGFLRKEVTALKANQDNSIQAEALNLQLQEEREKFSKLAGKLKLEIASLKRSLVNTDEELQRSGEEKEAEKTRLQVLANQLEEVKEVLRAEQRDYDKARKGWVTREDNLRKKIEKLQVRNILLENKIVDLKSRSTSLLMRNSELEVELANVTENLSQLNATVQESGAASNEATLPKELEDSMSALVQEKEDQIQKLNDLLEETEKDLKIAENRNILLKSDNTEIKTELQSLTTQLKLYEDKVQKSEQSVIQGKSEMLELKQMYEEKLQELEEARLGASQEDSTRINELQDTIQMLTNGHEQDIKALEEKYQIALDENDFNSKEKEIAVKENADLRSKIQSLELKCSHIKEKYEKISKYESERTSKEAQIKTLEAKISEMNNKLNSKASEVTRIKDIAAKDKAQILWQTDEIKKIQQASAEYADKVSKLENYAHQMRSKVRSLEKKLLQSKSERVATSVNSTHEKVSINPKDNQAVELFLKLID